MAAQERAKHAGQKLAPSSTEDNVPPVMQEQLMNDLPPPEFDSVFLPTQVVIPQESTPPSFHSFAMQHGRMKPPPVPAPLLVVVPSAPTFDLLDSQPKTTTNEFSKPLEEFEHIMEPPIESALSSEEEIIMGMEGLSAEERRALIDEQRTIMDQIEKEKAENETAIAAAAADDFDQRSTPAVAHIAGGGVARTQTTDTDKIGKSGRTVNLGGGKEVALHGPEKTRAAIKDGTALLVQCANCENWMQVTGSATLMYCPVCAVVSPVEVQSAVCTREEAIQMTMDRRMAEQMQKEEYEAVNKEDVGRAQGQEGRVTTKAAADEESSWWDTVSSMFTVKMANETVQPQLQKPLQRGEVGVSLPPGVRDQGSLSSAHTDIQTIDFSGSNDERDGLLGNQISGSRARVAERKPMFSCVVDSVANAGTYLGSALTTQTITEDGEGNVHGVDASSLLAVSTVSRETKYERL